ncbi:SCO6880 family protein [Streptomyces sp. 24-1644]|uniref:SCO6880 family protein n=1 Tax=Streptomyces sp. 24-1644 TaxID=3457315 RepID=UPI003FA6E747
MDRADDTPAGRSGGSSGRSDDAEPVSPVDQARHVEQSMGQKADYVKAEKAAAQAAVGAQVVDWTLMVTVTARSAAELPAARQEVERAIKATRSIRMRPAFGAQAAVFATGPPAGYNPLVK